MIDKENRELYSYNYMYYMIGADSPSRHVWTDRYSTKDGYFPAVGPCLPRGDVDGDGDGDGVSRLE